MFISRIRLFAALLAVSTAVPAHAKDTSKAGAEQTLSRTQEAVKFAESLTAQATIALTNDEKDETARIEDFKQILGDGLALEAIGRFMIGNARNQFTDAQRERYNTIFPNYITTLYAEQFGQIVGKPLNVVDAREISAKDVVVRTEFERVDDSPIMVDWRVRRLKVGDHKAIDIIVAGVSIMLVKREEFASFIEANGVDALLDRLETSTGG